MSHYPTPILIAFLLFLVVVFLTIFSMTRKRGGGKN